MLSQKYSCQTTEMLPGLEIRQNQHRVCQGGKEVNLTRLEYSTLVFLASNPGIVLTQTQILKPFGTWIAIAAIQSLRA